MSDQAGSLVEAMKAFASQFGEDSAFSRVVMEVLLEELMATGNSKQERVDVNGG